MAHNVGFSKLVERARDRIRECNVIDVKARMDNKEEFYFIDVREDHEFLRDYAKGAIHLGRGILERDIEALVPDKDAGIVLYCGGGYRSVLAAASLQDMGYTRVVSMHGGIKAWRQFGFPIEEDPGSAAPKK